PRRPAHPRPSTRVAAARCRAAAPLEPGERAFPAPGSGKPSKAPGRWCYRSGAVVAGEATLASGVDQTECGDVVRRTGPCLGGDRVLADRQAGYGGPLFPVVGGLWFSVGVQ